MTALRRLLSAGLLALALAPLPAHAGAALVYVTNSAGDGVHVIDTATNKVVQVIKGIEAAHGINFATDGSKVYVSNESTDTLDVFDRKTGELIKKIELSARPNNIAVSEDGARVVGHPRRAGSGRRHRCGDAHSLKRHPRARGPA